MHYSLLFYRIVPWYTVLQLNQQQATEVEIEFAEYTAIYHLI